MIQKGRLLRNLSVRRLLIFCGGVNMEKNQNLRELVTMQEMAERLKVPKSWLYRRTMSKGEGAIPRVQVGRYIRFHPETVLQWLEKTYQDGKH